MVNKSIAGRNKGFSLVEILCILAITGILLGIVYPSYTEYLQETRRSDATIALSSAASAQERWYTLNSSFTDDIDNLGGSDSPESFYSLSVEASSNSFTLTATAKSNGVQATDSGCTAMTLNHLGRALPNNCW
ncbi:MAG: type IV pilin protein [Endozoicomonas sp.]